MEKGEVETFIALAFKSDFDLDRRPKLFDSLFIGVDYLYLGAYKIE